jgi:hypothetical protein
VGGRGPIKRLTWWTSSHTIWRRAGAGTFIYRCGMGSLQGPSLEICKCHKQFQPVCDERRVTGETWKPWPRLAWGNAGLARGHHPSCRPEIFTL